MKLAFREFRTRRVLVVNETLAPRLLDAGLECFCLPLPAGVAVYKYARKHREGAQSLGQIVQKAVPITAKKISAAGADAKATIVILRLPHAGGLPLDDADDQKLLAQVVEYYQRVLKENVEGLDYLRNNGVTSNEAAGGISDRLRQTGAWG